MFYFALFVYFSLPTLCHNGKPSASFHSLLFDIFSLPTFIFFLFTCSTVVDCTRSCNNYMAFYTPTYPRLYIPTELTYTLFIGHFKIRKPWGFFFFLTRFLIFKIFANSIVLACLSVNGRFFILIFIVSWTFFFSFIFVVSFGLFGFVHDSCDLPDIDRAPALKKNKRKTCVIALFTKDDDVLHASHFTKSFRFSSFFPFYVRTFKRFFSTESR